MTPPFGRRRRLSAPVVRPPHAALGSGRRALLLFPRQVAERRSGAGRSAVFSLNGLTGYDPKLRRRRGNCREGGEVRHEQGTILYDANLCHSLGAFLKVKLNGLSFN